MSDEERGVTSVFISDVASTGIATSCLVCEEPVPIFDYQAPIKICEKCKAAVMQMRHRMEQEEGKEENNG